MLIIIKIQFRYPREWENGKNTGNFHLQTKNRTHKHSTNAQKMRKQHKRHREKSKIQRVICILKMYVYSQPNDIISLKDIRVNNTLCFY